MCIDVPTVELILWAMPKQNIERSGTGTYVDLKAASNVPTWTGMDLQLNWLLQPLLLEVVISSTICHWNCILKLVRLLHLCLVPLHGGIVSLSNHCHLCLKLFQSSRLCLVSLLEGCQHTVQYMYIKQGEMMQRKRVYIICTMPWHINGTYTHARTHTHTHLWYLCIVSNHIHELYVLCKC